MKTYAVLDTNNLVTNVIIASSLSVAEQVTSCNCVFVTQETGNAQIGFSYIDGVFKEPMLEEEVPTE